MQRQCYYGKFKVQTNKGVLTYNKKYSIKFQYNELRDSDQHIVNNEHSSKCGEIKCENYISTQEQVK